MKKIFGKMIAAFLAATLLASVFALPAFAAEAPVGTDAWVPADAWAVKLDGQDVPALKDSNRASSITLAAGQELAISSDRSFTRLYMVWDTPHSGWEIRYGDKTLTGGEGGFIHDYIELEGEATEVVFTLTEGEHLLCDVDLFGEGDLPDFVQVWQPTLEKADMLLLPTHADDEHLFFGGAMPLYAGERGMDVQVVYMTNHWAEAFRPHELLNGLWEVGVTAYPVMGPFPDLYASLESVESAEKCYAREEVLAFQVEMLRRFEPSVVIGHDINGEYGHGAHILNAQTLLEAIPLTNDAAAYPESAEAYGTCEIPKVYLHLWAENQITMDWNVPLERFGGATALDMAKAGFQEHASQLSYFAVEDFGDYDCRLFGLAHTTVGPDEAGNDFFENIDLNAEAEPAPVSSQAPESQPEEESEPVSSALIFVDPVQPEGFQFTPILIASIVILVVAAIIIVAVVAVYSRKNRRRRQRAQQKRNVSPAAETPPRAEAISRAGAVPKADAAPRRETPTKREDPPNPEPPRKQVYRKR